MSIDKISGFNNNNTEKITDNQSLKRNEVVKGKFNVPNESVDFKNVDKVEISSDVEKLKETLLNLKSELKKIPDIREEKLKNVRARIEMGFYEKEENIEQIANSIKKAGLRPLGT